jgi:hypothetical protein
MRDIFKKSDGTFVDKNDRLLDCFGPYLTTANPVQDP